MQSPKGWRLGIYDGASWKSYRLVVGGVTFDGTAEVLTLGDMPYIVFRDLLSGQYMCAKGTPPTP